MRPDAGISTIVTQQPLGAIVKNIFFILMIGCWRSGADSSVPEFFELPKDSLKII